MPKKILFFLFCFFFGASLAFAQSAPDPIRIATGARTLGMGKSFVGLSDDISSIFLNPAGLANIDRWQITSMSGKLLEEFNYVSISGLYPTNFGNFGVAYVRSDIGGAFPTTIEAASDPADPIFIIDTNQDPMSYYNNLFILSYGEKLEKFFMLPVLNNVGDRFPWFKQINFGANLKFFAVNLTGDHITQGSASGTEIDLGFQGKPLTWLSLGANVQNLLPTTMGGKLHYETGWDENYPAVLKLGAATNLFGPEESLLQLGQHNVKLLTDLDYEISRSDTIPTLLHLGVEWKPIDLIAIRAGIDQEMEGISSVANNLTSGVGLYYGDFRFDYAYHQFVGAPGVDNHFFSLSYGINPVSKNRERLIASPDQLVTKALVATIEGTAVDPKIVTLKINGLKVSLSPRGNFQARASLKTGKNTILVEGFAFEGDLADAKKLRVLRLLTYPDVPESFWAYQQINHIGTLGIIQGYPDGKFQPEGNITRAELSTLLMRTKMAGDDNVPKASNQVFKDVPTNHWGAKYINLAAENSIVKGYPDGSFKPSANVTRAEGLAMIARFGEVKNIPYANQFRDIVPRHWAAETISGADKEGLLIFLKDKPFEPNRLLTRAEAVELVYRTKQVESAVIGLLDFTQDY